MLRPNRLVSTIAVPALSLALALRTAHAQQPAVHGEGTVGNLSMWTGTTSSGRSILGDSLVTQWNGNVGVGVAAPTSRLAVQGMVEAVIDGYKFPDGTVQTTAAVTGLQSVAHDDTLAGDGTGASPLGLSVPLVLNGAPLQGVISVWDRNDTGSGCSRWGEETAVTGGAGPPWSPLPAAR